MHTVKIPELDAIGITEFDPTELPPSPSLGLCACRRSGKTVLVQPIIEAIKDRFEEIYFFSTTAKLLHNDYQFIPTENKYDHVNIDKIEQIIKRQEDIIEFNQTVPKSAQIKNRVCLLFDDCIQDNNSRSKVVDGLYTRGRHIQCAVFFLSQMYKNSDSGGFKKTARLNCDVLMSFVQSNENDRKCFVDENLSIIDKKQGMEIFKKITSNEYCAIVINLHKMPTARSYSDYVQYIKVDATKNFRKFMIQPEKVQVPLAKVNKSKPKTEFTGYGNAIGGGLHANWVRVSQM